MSDSGSENEDGNSTRLKRSRDLNNEECMGELHPKKLKTTTPADMVAGAVVVDHLNPPPTPVLLKPENSRTATTTSSISSSSGIDTADSPDVIEILNITAVENNNNNLDDIVQLYSDSGSSPDRRSQSASESVDSGSNANSASSSAENIFGDFDSADLVLNVSRGVSSSGSSVIFEQEVNHRVYLDSSDTLAENSGFTSSLVSTDDLEETDRENETTDENYHNENGADAEDSDVICYTNASYNDEATAKSASAAAATATGLRRPGRDLLNRRMDSPVSSSTVAMFDLAEDELLMSHDEPWRSHGSASSRERYIAARDLVLNGAVSGTGSVASQRLGFNNDMLDLTELTPVDSYLVSRNKKVKRNIIKFKFTPASVEVNVNIDFHFGQNNIGHQYFIYAF